jgi:hypothetical protein
MTPTVPIVLNGLARTLLMDLAPQVTVAYAGQTVQLAGVLTMMIAQEFERAAADWWRTPRWAILADTLEVRLARRRASRRYWSAPCGTQPPAARGADRLHRRLRVGHARKARHLEAASGRPADRRPAAVAAALAAS